MSRKAWKWGKTRLAPVSLSSQNFWAQLGVTSRGPPVRAYSHSQLYFHINNCSQQVKQEESVPRIQGEGPSVSPTALQSLTGDRPLTVFFKGNLGGKSEINSSNRISSWAWCKSASEAWFLWTRMMWKPWRCLKSLSSRAKLTSAGRKKKEKKKTAPPKPQVSGFGRFWYLTQGCISHKHLWGQLQMAKYWVET